MCLQLWRLMHHKKASEHAFFRMINPLHSPQKSLSTAQANYSNIERETLALIFGITRFHTYLFGKSFKVHTDHKPLAMIWDKPLTSAPPRLQRLLIKIQGYNFDIEYKPGNTMLLSDTLSRLPNQSKNKEIPLDLRIDGVNLEDIDSQMDLINFGSAKQCALQEETHKDPTLIELRKMVNTGWLETIKEVPDNLRQYWSFRDEIGASQGVLFKGRQVIIPQSLQGDL